MSLGDDKRLYILMTQAEELQKDAVALHKEVKRVAEEAQESIQKALGEVLNKNLYHTLVLVFIVLLIGTVVFWGCKLYVSSQMETANKWKEQAQVWADKAGKADLRECGDKKRFCVRVDKTAGVYGKNNEYMVIDGY